MSSADYDVAYCEACERCHLNGICPLTDKAQNAASMTDAGWAERKVARKLGGQYISLSPKLTADLLRAEHRRAVRVVKRELDTCVRQRESETDVIQRDRLSGAILACSNILAALQKGRT